VALILFLACGVGSVVMLMSTIFDALSGGVRFVVPGELTVTIEEPGKYTLWNETNSVHNGRLYPGSTELPGSLEIRVSDAFTGSTIPLRSSSSARETFGSTERTAISDIIFDRPGEYRIEVSGRFSERVFLLRRSACSDVLKALAAFIPLSILGWIAAPLIALVVFIRRSSAKKAVRKESAEITTGPAQTGHGTSSREDRDQTWATFCHLGSFAGYFFPFANIIVPLVIWLTKKEEYPLVDDQGKESLNFQISMTLYYLLSSILIIAVIGVFLLVGLGIFNLIAVTVAGVKANRGEKFRYPLCIRFVR